MELNEYQKRALETALYPKEVRILYPTLGLTGEAGEVADKVKKVIRDNDGDFSVEKRLEIAKELGDVLWYISTLANDLGYTLEEIGELNNRKLSSRKERGVISGNGDNR
jgi:NTP pyrophosphatase (non-canonical NTP hydrolase)